MSKRVLASLLAVIVLMATVGVLNVSAQRRGFRRNDRSKHSKLKGAVIGGAIGTVGGALIGGRKGALIGAGAGAGSGYLVQRHRNNRRHRNIRIYRRHYRRH